jgi:hypothetical protein
MKEDRDTSHHQNAEANLDQERVREKAAEAVLEWLERKRHDERRETISQVTIAEMAEIIRIRLGGGYIFFVVKDPDEIEAPLKAKEITVRLPETKMGDFTIQFIAKAVALFVRSDATVDELTTPEGDRALAKLYWSDQNIRPEDGRIFTFDPVVKIKHPDYGVFPYFPPSPDSPSL